MTGPMVMSSVVASPRKGASAPSATCVPMSWTASAAAAVAAAAVPVTGAEVSPNLAELWQQILAGLELPSTRMLLSQQAQLVRLDDHRAVVRVAGTWMAMVQSRVSLLEAAVARALGSPRQLLLEGASEARAAASAASAPMPTRPAPVSASRQPHAPRSRANPSSAHGGNALAGDAPGQCRARPDGWTGDPGHRQRSRQPRFSLSPSARQRCWDDRFSAHKLSPDGSNSQPGPGHGFSELGSSALGSNRQRPVGPRWSWPSP